MHQHSDPGEEAQSEDSLSPHENRSSQVTSSTEVPTRNSARHGTGPRTLEGKGRSKRNATKHGIFSSAVVLKDESRGDYESLLDGLWEMFQPEGKLEELLVEKLASTSWRYRRLLVAEGAEIRSGTEFVEWDQQNKEQEEAMETGTTPSLTLVENLGDDSGGLIEKIGNPQILEYCLELLLRFRQQMETDGLSEDQDDSILRKIYGSEDRACRTLYDSYKAWSDTMEASEEERNREKYATPEQCRRNIISEIDKETSRLKHYREIRASIESNRTKLEILRRSIPDSPRLDRLLRYEASLERVFDRTLNQLERLQRMRQGQPVAPRIDVNLSAS